MVLDPKIVDEAKKILTAYLEKKELRKTPERFAILDEIYSRNDHFDVEMLYVSMKNKNYRVSRATVYNTLEIFIDCNLVTKHQFGKNQAQFEKSFGNKQHDHMICVDCHLVKEFCDPRLQNTQSMVEDVFKTKIMHHSLILYGHCMIENCANKKTR